MYCFETAALNQLGYTVPREGGGIRTHAWRFGFLEGSDIVAMLKNR